jgi:hypothetical protein
MDFNKVFAVGAGFALVMFGTMSIAEAAPNGSCSRAAINRISALARQTIAISKTNPDLALKMAQSVARNAPTCQQVAYGAILDGAGTASTGERRGRGERERERRRRPRGGSPS